VALAILGLSYPNAISQRKKPTNAPHGKDIQATFSDSKRYINIHREGGNKKLKRTIGSFHQET